MMARSSTAPAIGRIQKRKTNFPKSSFSACNARPVHTSGHYGKECDFFVLYPRGGLEMASVCENCGERLWSFFPSRERLQKYIDWMATPAEPKMKVVRSIKDHPKHVPPTKDQH